MSTMIRTESVVPACVQHTDVFQHPLLEDAAPATTSTARRELAGLTARAESVCLECPLMTQCVYNAVVRYDVAGYVAGTTVRQRQTMRQHLGVRVQSDDLDTLAGVIAPNRQVSHEEVVRLRKANPHESLETLAHRLGCSLSTVKRHLRKERNTPSPRLRSLAPTPEQVLHVFALVTRRAARPAEADLAQLTA